MPGMVVGVHENSRPEPIAPRKKKRPYGDWYSVQTKSKPIYVKQQHAEVINFYT
jgi:hypothetical protein